MNIVEIIAQDVFDKVRSRFSNLEMGDENGTVTTDPRAARFFDFDFAVEGNTLGRVSISINELGTLKLFYGQGITEGVDPITTGMWYDFLKEMRYFAKRRMLRFDTRDITKGNLNKSDFQYLAQNGTKESNMSESTMYGSKKTSYRKLENTLLRIRHSKPVDETSRGARSRNINALFIENEAGERFKYPFNHLAGAKAMQRHVANGGRPYDDAGQAIINMSEQIAKLVEFKRHVAHHDGMNQEVNEIIGRSQGKLDELRKTVENLSKQGYYESWIENLQPTEDDGFVMDQATYEDYKSKFTVKSFKEDLAEYFPLIHKIMQETSELDLNQYVDNVTEGVNLDQDKLNKVFQWWDRYMDDVRAYGSPDYNKVMDLLRAGDIDEAVAELAYAYTDQDGGEIPRMDAYMDDLQGEIEHAMGVGESSSPDDFASFEAWAETVADPISAQVSEQAGFKEGDQVMYMNKPATIVGVEGDQVFIKIEGRPGTMGVPAAQIKPIGGASQFKRGDVVMYKGQKVTYIRPLADDPEQSYVTFPTGADDIVPTAELTPAQEAMENEEPAEQKVSMKEIAEVVKSFYDKETGKFPKGETGVITHIKKQFGEKAGQVAERFVEQLSQSSQMSAPVAEGPGGVDPQDVQAVAEFLKSAIASVEEMKDDPEAEPEDVRFTEDLPAMIQNLQKLQSGNVSQEDLVNAVFGYDTEWRESMEEWFEEEHPELYNRLVSGRSKPQENMELEAIKRLSGLVK